MSRYTIQSSAKSLTLEWILEGWSLIYTRNNNGPRTVPCGTPDVTLHLSEASPSTTTCWWRLVRKESIHLRVLLLIPMLWSFLRRRWCGTESKALLKSIMIRSTWPLSSKTLARSLTSADNWVSQERPLRNPCWTLTKTLNRSKWFMMWWWMICSRIKKNK